MSSIDNKAYTNETLQEHEKYLKPHVGKDAEVWFHSSHTYFFRGTLVRIPKRHDNHESDLEFGIACAQARLGKSEDGRHGTFYNYFKLMPETVKYANTIPGSDKIKIVTNDDEFIKRVGTIFCADKYDRIKHFGYDMFKA